VLNALVWLTGADVPAGGVASVVSAEDLARDLDVNGKGQAKTTTIDSRTSVSGDSLRVR
jgi:hypothetical protein